MNFYVIKFSQNFWDRHFFLSFSFYKWGCETEGVWFAHIWGVEEWGFKNKSSSIKRQYTAVTKNSYYESQRSFMREHVYLQWGTGVPPQAPGYFCPPHSLLPSPPPTFPIISKVHSPNTLNFFLMSFFFLRMPFYLIHSSSTSSSYVITSSKNHFQTLSKSTLSP